MVNLLGVVSCLIVIFGSMILYLPLNALLSSSSWLSLSYGAITQALLPVFILAFDLVMCPILLITTVED